MSANENAAGKGGAFRKNDDARRIPNLRMLKLARARFIAAAELVDEARELPDRESEFVAGAARQGLLAVFLLDECGRTL
jgi:hypothetical protein